MTKAMPFLRKYDITFLRPPPFWGRWLAAGKTDEVLRALSFSKAHLHHVAQKPLTYQLSFCRVYWQFWRVISSSGITDML